MFNPYLFYGAQNLNQINTQQVSPYQSNFSSSSTSVPFYQKMLSLIETHNKTLIQLESLKSQLLQVKKNVQKITNQMQASETGSVIDILVQRKTKKIFKKNISCPFEFCQSKYSSKIALNSHLRIKHGRKWLQQSQNQREQKKKGC